MKVFSILASMSVLSMLVSTTACDAQIKFDGDPINYSKSAPQGVIAKLQREIDAGRKQLKFDPKNGYLADVLRALGVSTDSQMLVFSKTSFQLRRITPETPRALYFNDHVYIGWVPNGDVIEVASVDPKLGAVFYTLRQEPEERPKFVRDRGNCLTCHASSRTHGVPGHFVRSVFPSGTGLPHYGAGTFRTTQASPLKERWGGWYVTGTHGTQRHMGNVIVQDRRKPEVLDVEKGANVTDLRDHFSSRNYMAKHSDIVALMVLEHQGETQNLITRAQYEARLTRHYDATMNKALERPDDHQSDVSKRRLETASRELLEHMLFVDEVELTDTIRGTSPFAKRFADVGPKDGQGRSLRQFDLRRRLFKYPCSYLIYSEPFLALPRAVKDRVYRGLWDVVTGKDESPRYAHLSAGDRSSILSILRDTHPDLPAYWKSDKSVGER